MTIKLNISKPGYNVLTETDYNNLAFSSEKGTLKYLTSGSVNQSFTSDELIEINIVNFQHNLGYAPYVEVYVKDQGGEYQPCPLLGTGAGTVFEYAAYITTSYIFFRTYFTGFDIGTDFDVTFYYFIFKDDTGLL